MKQYRQRARRFLRLRQDQKGATAIEFAVVSFVFFMLMFGIIEYGLIMLTSVAVEAATIQVSRSSGIGVGGSGCADRVSEIKRLVQEKSRGLVRPESVMVTSTIVSSPTTATPPKPDICLDNPNVPYPATCNSWVENTGNPAKYDPPPALGCSEQNEVVEIRVTYLWRVLFPMFRSYFGKDGVLTISSSTVVKNEPFSGN